MLIGKSIHSGFYNNQRGFILIGVLVLIMISGYALSNACAKFSELQKREKEQELLKIGDTIRKAIGNYYNQTPGLVKQYPPNLESLLNDNRFPMPRRYLRKLYLDPITMREGWGIVEAPSGGVMGVYSLSDKSTFKKKNFNAIYKSFEGKQHYGQWYFTYLP